MSESGIPEGFKTTELCSLPEEWKVVRLGEVAKVKYGKANPKDTGNIPVVGSGGIYSSTTSPLVEYPTIIIGRKGTAGKVWLFLKPCYPSDTTFYLEWKKDIDVSFLFNYLVLNPLSGEHAKTTLPSLQKPDLENHLIPHPPIPEQHRIAAVLSAVQDAKEKTGAVIAAAKSLKKSLMRHLFTYGPVSIGAAESVPLAETEIGLVPEGWGVVMLGSVAKIKYGKANPKDTGNVPVVGSGGIYSSTANPLVDYPTIIIGRKGTAGKVWLFLNSCYPSDTTFYLEWKEDIDVSFLFNYMASNPLSGEHAKTTLPSLQKPDLENYPIPLPPHPIQQKIASILSTVDKKIEAEENKKKVIDELFKSLLRNLMTAKIRVNHLEVTQ